DRGQERPTVGDVTCGARTCRPVSVPQPDHRIEPAHQAAGCANPAGAIAADLSIGQIKSRPIATAALFGDSGFGGMVGASRLALAKDAIDARRDLLWPELAPNLLRRRSAGVRQPHGAARHLGRACDADSTESRWDWGDDRDRNTAELDRHQTQ